MESAIPSMHYYSDLNAEFVDGLRGGDQRQKRQQDQRQRHPQSVGLCGDLLRPFP